MAELISLTPGERDAAKAAIIISLRGNPRRHFEGLVVDDIIDAINRHRARTNELAEQHGCHR
jgi:hypothetical protein